MPNSGESNLDINLAAMARGARHLLTQTASLSSAHPSLQAEVSVVREALTKIQTYLAAAMTKEYSVREKEQAHERAVLMFDALQNFLDKVGLKLANGGSSW